MKKKILGIAVVMTIIGLITVPSVVLTQGALGRVLNKRTRVVTTGTDALSTAVGAALAGDILLLAGNLNETAGVDLTGFTGTLVGETRRGFQATVRIVGGLCPALGAVIDASNRAGTVSLIGFNLVVPDVCIGIQDDTNVGAGAGTGLPLTIQNMNITGAAGAVYDGICINDQTAGPFNILNSRVTGELGNACTTSDSGGITVDGDGTALTTTVRGNRVTNTTANGDGFGINIEDIGAGSVALVERNIVDGGGAVAGIGIGIFFGDGDDGLGVDGTLTAQRNTVRNFSAPGGVGFDIDNANGLTVRQNLITNNDFGFMVDDATCSPGPAFPLINLNNIRGSLTAAMDFNGAGPCGYTLDASNNYWDAASGPRDIDGDAFCGGTPATCNLAAGAGGAIDAQAGGAAADCGGGIDLVNTCLFRTIVIFGTGA
jgi:hypothetical protein